MSDVVLDVLTSNSNPFLMASFIIHLLLTSFGVQGYWSPDSYFFYNTFFFLTLLFSIYSSKKAELPLVINIISIFLDVIVLSIYFPGPSYGSSERFSAGMAILNLILRPISSYILFKEWLQGLPGGGGGAGGDHASYNDI